MVDKHVFECMKSTAILINTARGEIVNQQDLYNAIVSGQIAGAGLDTLFPEPVPFDHPLLQLPEHLRYKVTFFSSHRRNNIWRFSAYVSALLV